MPLNYGRTQHTQTYVFIAWLASLSLSLSLPTLAGYNFCQFVDVTNEFVNILWGYAIKSYICIECTLTHSPARWLVRSVICSRSQHIICTIMYDVVEHSLLQTKHTQIHIQRYKEKNETHLLYSFTCSIVTQEFIQRLHFFCNKHTDTIHLYVLLLLQSVSLTMFYSSIKNATAKHQPPSLFFCTPTPPLEHIFHVWLRKRLYAGMCHSFAHFPFHFLFLAKVSFGTCHWKG